jgi:hypothetical protein
MKRLTWLVLLFALFGSLGAVVAPGGLKPSTCVDDYSDVYLADGATDATAAILLCLQVSGAADLGPGTYLVSETAALTMPDGTRLSGAGMGITTLVGTVAQTGVILRTGSNCTVRDLTIAGSDEASDTASRPGSGEDNVLYERVEFKDCPIGSETTGVMDSLTFRSCKFNSCGTVGFQTGSADRDGLIQDCVFVNCPIGITFSASPLGWQIVGGLVDTATTGINLNSLSNGVVDGVAFVSCTTTIQIGTGARCDIGENYYASDEVVPSDVTTTQTSLRGRYYNTASPSTGTWLTGDIVHNSTPGTSGATATHWLCSTGGTSGTWQPAYRAAPHLTVTEAWDPASMNDNTGTSKSDFSVTGATLGARVVVGAPYEIPAGVMVTASIVSSNTIRVSLWNHSGGVVDLASGNWTLEVTQ